LNKIIKADHIVDDVFYKLESQEVYENYIDWKQMSIDLKDDYKKNKITIENCFTKMRKENDGYFSFKYIPKDLRKYFTKTMGVRTEETIDIAKFINDRNILILDDTITSGTTISSFTKILMDVYAPKSITIITLFSKLEE
jgi:phosphoribosylpyrophosphate synthetase